MQRPICSAPACRSSFCDYHSDVNSLSNLQFMRSVVNDVFQELFASSLSPFFDGTAPGILFQISLWLVLISLTGTSTNYITNAQRRQQLVDHFVSYFGQTDKARCTDNGFPGYSGRSLHEAHQNMAIGFEEFATFNEIFLQTLVNKNFPDNDILLFASVLNNTVVSNPLLHSFICYIPIYFILFVNSNETNLGI
jgi:hypothetical protein